MELVEGIIKILVAGTLLICAWMTLNWMWLRPKKLEKQLRQHGFHGNSYRLWSGDQKEEMSLLTEALSKPIPLDHDIAPRIFPFIHKHVSIYGMYLAKFKISEHKYSFLFSCLDLVKGTRATLKTC